MRGPFPLRLLFVRRFSRSTNPNHVASHIPFFLSLQFHTLQSLLRSHALFIVTGNVDNPFIAAKLISLYALHHRPLSSDKVFDSVSLRDTFLWNSFIKSHFSNRDYGKAVGYYTRMRLGNCLPDNFTVPMVISACAELLEADFGESVHGLVEKLGLLFGNSAAGSSLVYLYSKCGRVESAAKVFDEMTVRDVVAWTALVIGYVQNGESEKGLGCLCEMQRVGVEGEKPNSRTLEGGLQGCGNLGALDEGRCLHSLVIKRGFSDSPEIRSSLLSLYSKFGTAQEACLSFREDDNKDLLCWTSIIGVYAQLGRTLECSSLFKEMLDAGIHPDGIVISCILSSFRDSMKIREGKIFHGFLVRRIFILDHVVHSGLISMYCRFGLLASAENLLDKGDYGNSDSWNVMVLEYAKRGLPRNCIDLFREMQHQGIECDLNCTVSVMSSCSQLRQTYLGRSLHCYAIRGLLHEHTSLSNSLIDLYGKSGKLDGAEKVFHQAQRDTVSWNILMSAYAHGGYLEKVTGLFDTMISEGLTPNSATIVALLSTCSNVASLEEGERVHNYIKETGMELNLQLATALMDMYGKCGQLKKSREVFDSMREKDIVSWNVMISCYGMHGDALSAIGIFEDMENSGIQPNGVTFLALLTACNHSSLSKEGRSFFYRMKDYSVEPTLKHYACIVDLLAKSGNLQEAEELVLSMPIAPDGGIWGTLLTACKLYSEVDIGMRIFKHAIESDPENDGYYIIMPSLFDSVGRWEEAEMMRKVINERGLRKSTGWSTL